MTGLTVTSKQRCGCTGATLSNTCPATACTAPTHALVYVEVNVTGTFNSMFNYPGLPASITVNKTYDMRVAQ